MNFDNFTIKSQEAIQRAADLARTTKNQAVETGHLLMAILETGEHLTRGIFGRMGIDAEAFKNTLGSILQSYPKVEGGEIYLSKGFHEAINRSKSLLKQFGDSFVSPEHLMLALLKSGDIVSSMMRDAGISEDQLM